MLEELTSDIVPCKGIVKSVTFPQVSKLVDIEGGNPDGTISVDNEGGGTVVNGGGGLEGTIKQGEFPLDMGSEVPEAKMLVDIEGGGIEDIGGGGLGGTKKPVELEGGIVLLGL